MTNKTTKILPTLYVIGLSIIGWSCYAFADAISKYLSADYPISLLLISSSTLNLIVLGTWILWKRGVSGFQTPQLKLHLMRAVMVAGISYCVLHAIALIPLANFYGIMFSTPFMILVLIGLVLDEHIGWRRWAAVIVGFIGILILAGPSFAALDIGVIFAVCAVVFQATGAIVIRKIGTEEFFPLYAFFPFLGIWALNVPIGLHEFTFPAVEHLWLFAFQAALVSGGMFMVTYSIAHARETAMITPFMYIQVLWGSLFGYFLFGDLPTQTTILGLSIIVSAGLYSIWREHQLAQDNK